MKKLQKLQTAVLQWYIYTVSTYPGYVMLISAAVSITFSAIGLSVAGVPNISDPAAGLESRGDDLILDILTWKKLKNALISGRMNSTIQIKPKEPDLPCLVRDNSANCYAINYAATNVFDDGISIYLKLRNGSDSMWTAAVMREFCVYSQRIDTLVTDSRLRMSYDAAFFGRVDLPLLSMLSIFNCLSLPAKCDAINDSTVTTIRMAVERCSSYSFSDAFEHCEANNVPLACRSPQAYLLHRALPERRSVSGTFDDDTTYADDGSGPNASASGSRDDNRRSTNDRLRSRSGVSEAMYLKIELPVMPYPTAQIARFGEGDDEESSRGATELYAKHRALFNAILNSSGSANDELKYLELAGIHAGLREKLFLESLISDLAGVAAGMVLVCVLITTYGGSLFFMVVTALAMCFSVGLAYFVYTVVLGIRFFPFLNLLSLVILVAVGSDDAFILHKAWRKAEDEYLERSFSDVDRLTNEAERGDDNDNDNDSMTLCQEDLTQIAAASLPHAVGSMFVTSLTTSAALFVNTVSSVVVIKCFGVIAGLIILLCYCYVITWLAAAVVFERKIPMMWAEWTEAREDVSSREKREPKPGGLRACLARCSCGVGAAISRMYAKCESSVIYKKCAFEAAQLRSKVLESMNRVRSRPKMKTAITKLKGYNAWVRETWGTVKRVWFHGLDQMFGTWLPWIIYRLRWLIIVGFILLTVLLSLAAFNWPGLNLPHKNVDRLFVDMTNPQSNYDHSIRQLYAASRPGRVSIRFLWGFRRDDLSSLAAYDPAMMGQPLEVSGVPDLTPTHTTSPEQPPHPSLSYFVGSRAFLNRTSRAIEYFLTQPEVAPAHGRHTASARSLNLDDGNDARTSQATRGGARESIENWVDAYLRWSRAMPACDGDATANCTRHFFETHVASPARRRKTRIIGGEFLYSVGSPSVGGPQIIGLIVTVRLRLIASYHYEHLEKFVGVSREFQTDAERHFGLPRPAIISEPTHEFVWYNLLNGLIAGTKLSIFVSVIIALLCVLVTTRNLVSTVVSLIVISATLLAVLGILALAGWQLNVIESILIILAVGLSFDFTLHYAVAFNYFNASPLCCTGLSRESYYAQKGGGGKRSKNGKSRLAKGGRDKVTKLARNSRSNSTKSETDGKRDANNGSNISIGKVNLSSNETIKNLNTANLPHTYCNHLSHKHNNTSRNINNDNNSNNNSSTTTTPTTNNSVNNNHNNSSSNNNNKYDIRDSIYEDVIPHLHKSSSTKSLGVASPTPSGNNNNNNNNTSNDNSNSHSKRPKSHSTGHLSKGQHSSSSTSLQRKPNTGTRNEKSKFHPKKLSRFLSKPHSGVENRERKAELPLRHRQVVTTLEYIGCPVAMAAFTSVTAGLCMFGSNTLPFFQIGFFLVIVMITSWVYSTFLYLSLIAVICDIIDWFKWYFTKKPEYTLS